MRRREARGGARGVEVAYGVGGALEGEVDVEEGGDGLHGAGVLGVVEEVALAGLVFGIPVEDVELRVVGPLVRRRVVGIVGVAGSGSGIGIVEAGEGGVLELLLRFARHVWHVRRPARHCFG